jgi:hypothetical protein
VSRSTYTLTYHEVTKFFWKGSEHYGLPIMKCPNCNSFRMVVDMVDTEEPPKFVKIPFSALHPIEELKHPNLSSKQNDQ